MGSPRRAVGVAAFAVVVTRSAQRPPATTPPGGREKDGRASAFQGHAIQPELVVLAATKQPPSAGNRKGRVKARADTGPAEVLLFRIRLPAPAWVYLFAVTQSSKPLRLWPEEGSEWHPAGEFEVSNDGSVLALDPRRLASDARLLLIAAPAALDRARLAGLPTEPAAIAAALPECGIDVVPVSGKPP